MDELEKQQELISTLEKLGRCSDNDLKNISVSERVDMFINLGWNSRHLTYKSDQESLNLSEQIDTQQKRLLLSFSQKIYSSPETSKAARDLAVVIDELFMSKQLDVTSWNAAPPDLRLSILQQIHTAHASLLGFPSAKIETRASSQINFDFVDGDFLQGESSEPHSEIRVNTHPDCSPKRSLREDVETVVMLGLKKLTYAYMLGYKLGASISDDHKRLLEFSAAEVAWRYQPKHLNDYILALHMPGTSIGRQFLNKCFGASKLLSSPIVVSPILPASLINSPIYCSIDSVSGYCNYFKSKFIESGPDAIGTLPEDVRRKIVREFYQDTRNEITTHASKGWGWFVSADNLGKIFGAIPFQQEYQQYYREKSLVLAQKLENDFFVRVARQTWIIMPNLFRRKLLSRITRFQDEVFSHNTFGFSQRHPLLFEKMSLRTAGVHDSATDKITLNTLKGAGWNKFTSSVRVLIHEKTHDHQTQITRAYETGRLSEGSPFYNQAKEFEDYFVTEERGERIYIQPHQDYSAYNNHPIERQAREIADTVVDYIGPALLEKVYDQLASRLKRSPLARFVGVRNQSLFFDH